MSAEERAAELVAVACRDTPANLCVELRGPGLDPVRVFHSPNPALVREMAEAVRAFVAAVLREAAGDPERCLHSVQSFRSAGREMLPVRAGEAGGDFDRGATAVGPGQDGSTT